MNCMNYKNINNPQTRSSLIDTLELKDVFQCLNNDLRRYTWHCKNPTRHARLDYVLTSANLLEFIDKCCIKPGYRSDHSLIELTLITCKSERGRGLWKFDCSFLKDKKYLICINDLIDREKLRYSLPVYNPVNLTAVPHLSINFTINDSQFLKVLFQIHGETIKYATSVKQKNCQKEKNLINEIESLEKNIKNLDSPNLAEKKKELEALRKQKINGIMIRSRPHWLSESEKFSKFFVLWKSITTPKKLLRK